MLSDSLTNASNYVMLTDIYWFCCCFKAILLSRYFRSFTITLYLNVAYVNFI